MTTLITDHPIITGLLILAIVWIVVEIIIAPTIDE